MISSKLKVVIAFIAVSVFSCNEPETIVTNIVNRDGSVLRKIEVRSQVEDINSSLVQVPFDSTWIVTDSVEVTDNNDTVWVKRAEKLFPNVDGINSDYLSDSSSNSDLIRSARFSKSFRWFNTHYRFEESIGKTMTSGYPVSDFLQGRELDYFYCPDDKLKMDRNSRDSLIVKAIEDSIRVKTDWWFTANVISEWIVEFSRLAGADLSYDSLKSRESDFVGIIIKYEQKFDSLWENGVILKEMIGEQASAEFRSEADSALNIVTNRIITDFNEYSVRIVMPGTIVSTNGFIDSLMNISWPVKSDFFLAEEYVMTVESKTANIWAWALTILFLVFVSAGLLLKNKRAA